MSKKEKAPFEGLAADDRVRYDKELKDGTKDDGLINNESLK